ncbi:PIN-like domain-containing protein [Facklamia sp. 7083-14-GEN3]|uniref:PIN-like domain-containing protein n=1 Tax=Facklamia sp. 7083-14-GEN3 TaxID=2973478 RepID=UPI00215CAD2F|nr:PIN-like domain-containing protein [Facklamia sp. 7083-14-GEN3]MCR8969783.1 PIN-like domain-containing protein [Facklamia sp. 7083-14-GEN3]
MNKSYIDILIKKNNVSESETCYVLDTNFLLNSLISVKYADQYIEALKKNKSKIFIPFIVWVEFIYNVDKLLNQNSNFLKQYMSLYKFNVDELSLFTDEDIKNKINNYFNISKRLSENSIGRKLVKEDIEEIFPRINFETSFNEVNKEIMNSFEEWRQQATPLMKKINNYDVDTKERLKAIRKMIDEEDIYLGKEYTQEYLEKLENNAQIRIEKKLPPGISDEDLSKEGFKIWKEINIPSKYGDIFLWLEILDHVKSEESFDEITLVSDDTKKGDWISKDTNDLFNSMKIEINNVNPSLVVNHVKSSEFVEKFNSSHITKEEIEKDLKQYQNDFSQEDTIVVPARKEGFEKVFIGENRWYSIRILNERIPYIKYIAAYQTNPISAITHYAKIEKIVDSPIDSNKKMIIFEGDAIELETPVKLGSNWSAMQSVRYTSIEKIFDVTDLDDLF